MKSDPVLSLSSHSWAQGSQQEARTKRKCIPEAGRCALLRGALLLLVLVTLRIEHRVSFKRPFCSGLRIVRRAQIPVYIRVLPGETSSGFLRKHTALIEK